MKDVHTGHLPEGGKKIVLSFVSALRVCGNERVRAVPSLYFMFFFLFLFLTLLDEEITKIATGLRESHSLHDPMISYTHR